jgi:uncharacterized protein
VKLRLVPRDTGLHYLFVRQAALAVEAAMIRATELGEYRDPAAASRRLRDLEHAGDDVNHETIAHLARTFVAPFDRTAIHDLTTSIDDVLDRIEEVADKLLPYRLAAHLVESDGAR